MRPVRLRRGSGRHRTAVVAALVSMAAERLVGTLDRVERAKAWDQELIAVVVEPGAANGTRGHGLIVHSATCRVASRSASRT